LAASVVAYGGGEARVDQHHARAPDQHILRHEARPEVGLDAMD
jgi:hypothetical protein